MTTLYAVLREIIDRGDIVPDVNLSPGVWHKVEFSVFTTTDDVMVFDKSVVVSDETGEVPL